MLFGCYRVVVSIEAGVSARRRGLWRLTLRGEVEVCIGGERVGWLSEDAFGGMSEYVAGMSWSGILGRLYWYRGGYYREAANGKEVPVIYYWS